MYIKKVMNDYFEHQSKKLAQIQLAATVAEANAIKAIKASDQEEVKTALESVLADLRMIKDELTKNDYLPREEES